MKQVKLTNDKIEDLNRNGYTFTRSYYYWKVLDVTNIVNRITRAEFMVRSIAEPLHGVEQVRIYKRGGGLNNGYRLSFRGGYRGTQVPR